MTGLENGVDDEVLEAIETVRENRNYVSAKQVARPIGLDNDPGGLTLVGKALTKLARQDGSGVEMWSETGQANTYRLTEPDDRDSNPGGDA